MRTVHNLSIQKRRRKYLRNNSTKAEEFFWQYIKDSQLGYKFRRQHSIKNYIVDFYCPKLKLIVELDGEVHDYILQSNKDYLREEKLKKLGFKVIRYKNEDIKLNTDGVLKNLREVCEYINNNLDK